MTNLSKSFCLGVFFPSGFGTDTHEKCCILISEIFPKTHLRLSSVDFFSRGSMPPNPPRTGAYTQFRPRYAPATCTYIIMYVNMFKVYRNIYFSKFGSKYPSRL